MEPDPIWDLNLKNFGDTAVTKQIYTTFGPMTRERLGRILVHEHIFTETGKPPASAYLGADVRDVIETMSPLIAEVRSRGIDCLFDATPVGVGRRADIVRAVSVNTGLCAVIPTGVYREPWIPDAFFSMSREQITAWMTDELNKGIEDTGIRAGFIKLSASDSGLTACEEKIFRAACSSSLQTGAAVGSHTITGHTALRQTCIMEEEGVSPSRFIWIHAAAETDMTCHLKIAGKGAYLEYDWINSPENDLLSAGMIGQMKNEGFFGQILISMDSGWYNPRFPHGGSINGYTHLSDFFLPMLSDLGYLPAEIDRLMHDNVFDAFGRE